jgi:hypothetical protein
VDGGFGGEVPLAPALRALAELPPDGDPAEVLVIRPQPRRTAPSTEKWFRRAVASFSPGASAHRSLDVRLHVLHPERALPGSYLDFTPREIRTYYEDGLHTARDWMRGGPTATAPSPLRLPA